jgi:MFS family permease
VLREYFRHISGFAPAAKFYLAGQFFYSIGQTAVWVLRNLFFKEAGFSEDFIGQTLAVSSFGAVVVVLTMSRFMDGMRLRGFSILGAVALSVGLAGAALTASKAAVLGFCFLSGLGSAQLELGTAPFLARHSQPVERPFLFGVSTALSPLAGLLATLGIKGGTVAWHENLETYRLLMVAAAILTALSVCALVLMREAEPERHPEEGRRFDWKTAARFFIPEAMIGLGAGLTIPFINLYFRNRFDRQAGEIGLYFTGAQALVMVAFLAAPLLARRFGPVKTVVACQLSSIPFFFVLAVTTSLPVAVTAFLLRHACMNMVHPVGSHFAMELVNPRERVRVNGLKQAANKTAWVIANAIGGWLIAHTTAIHDGFSTTMFVTIGLYVVGSWLYWAFFSKVPAGQAPVPEAEPTAGT